MKKIFCAIALLLIWILCGAPSCGGRGNVRGGGGGNPAGDTTPPTVSSTAPANGAVGVPTNISSITANFSEEIDPSTLIFTVSNGGSVNGTVNYSGTTAIFTPALNLAGNTTYTARISGSVKDLAGNAMGLDHVWTLTTGAGPDTDPPTVVSNNPISNATGVALDANFEAIFSEEIDCSTVNTSTFAIENATGYINSCSGNKAIFIPNPDLDFNTTYTARIKASVKDIAGNPMASDYTWTFTTGNAPVKVYVPINGGGDMGSFGYHVRVINTENNSVKWVSGGNLFYAGNPVSVAVMGNKVFGTNEANGANDPLLHNAVSIVNTLTDAYVDGTNIHFSGYPRWIDTDPSTNKVYVSRESGAIRDIKVIDAETSAILNTITGVTDANRFSGYLLINPSARELYALNRNKVEVTNDTITVIDLDTNSIKGTIVVGAGPFGAAIDIATNLLYIANAWTHSISVIDLATYNVVDTIALSNGTYPCGLVVKDGYLYIAANGTGELLKMDLATYGITSVLTGGIGPGYLVLYNGKAYVTDWGTSSTCGNTVAVINTTEPMTLETSIPVGACPVGLGIYIP